MQKVMKQLTALFWAMKLKQKIFFIAASSTLLFIASWVLLTSRYSPLMSERTFSTGERKKVEELLDKKGIKYRQNADQIYLPEKQRKEVEEKVEKLLHEEQHLGFELFDTNTWIKGEKELQMLEMRALKGQLEKDLSSFENIKDATVILDVAPQKIFGNAKYKTKASVIITLEEGAELSSSQLRAIAYHLSGAVRGLEPSRIAISDTTGKLYKAIYQEGEDSLFTQNPTISKEEEMIERMTKMLTKIVGKGKFHLHFHMGDKEHQSIVALIIDKSALESSSQEAIENQLRALLKESDEEPMIAIDFAYFQGGVQEQKRRDAVWPYMLLALAILLASLFFCFGRSREKSTKKQIIDMSKLAHLIKDQDPKTIALMFSYLEEEKAEQLLFALPYAVQKKVALHLPGIHKEDA